MAGVDVSTLYKTNAYRPLPAYRPTAQSVDDINAFAFTYFPIERWCINAFAYWPHLLQSVDVSTLSLLLTFLQSVDVSTLSFLLGPTSYKALTYQRFRFYLLTGPTSYRALMYQRFRFYLLETIAGPSTDQRFCVQNQYCEGLLFSLYKTFVKFQHLFLTLH